MKKVLIIAYNDLNNSGVPNVIYQTIKALHTLCSFDVLIFDNDDYYYQKLCEEGIDVNLIKYIDKKPKTKLARFLWWFYKRPHDQYLFAKRLMRNNNYSIVHSFKEYYSWPFFKAAKKEGIKKIIYHTNVDPEFSAQLTNRLLETKNRRLSLKYSTKLVGVSETSCKNAFKNNDYIILHNSYNEQKYNMNVKNKLTNNELVITQVGYYCNNKNQFFSLQVLNELKKMYKNVRLNLVGASEITPYHQKLIDYAKVNNLSGDVFFINKTNDVDKIYEKTTFVIIPSLREGFSLVAVEAQACGIFVFASSNIPKEVDCGGIEYLDLKSAPTYWAKEIFRKFTTVSYNRRDYGVDKFASEKFKRQLERIYFS